MDIRTKLVFGFVAVTLGSMLAFGWVTYVTAKRMMGEGTEEQLEGLAESSVGALESIAEGWRERVQLIASRTQLRMSLRDYNESADPETADRIERILADAGTSVPSVASLAVYDPDGFLVASSGPDTDSVPGDVPADSLSFPSDKVVFLGASFVPQEPDEPPRVAYSRVLMLDGERVGVLYVLLKAYRLAALTGDYTGLGETGEVLIVARYGSGVRTLHPVRHEQPGDGEGWIRLAKGDELAARALGDDDTLVRGGVVDYRGEDVWAATRHLDRPDWGLIVKFDSAEKSNQISEFRDRMIALALSLAGLGILVAFILGYRFAGPIHELAQTANLIREGDLTARAPVRRQDEIGLLARTFNETAKALEKQVTELHEFHKFFDVSLDMLCIAGTDGFFKRTNPAFTKTLGWDAEELLSRPFFDLIHPDDVAATQHEIAKLSQGIPTISFVNRFRCSDGTWKYLRWNSYPEPETGLLYAIARETAGPQAS